MPEEIEGVVDLLSEVEICSLGKRDYYKGRLNGIQVVVVFSRWGKVAAATTVSTLILEFQITELIFTGVAGGIDSRLKIGDVVIGSRLFQHDIDARPLMKQFEIPLLGKIFLESPLIQLNSAIKAVEYLIDNQHLHALFANDDLERFGIDNPSLFVGDIASGDTFFSSHQQKMVLSNNLPTILCVEMEGAAVAQVCFEYDIPFTIIRTISDVADDQSHLDFPLFISKIGSKYSVEIVKNIFSQIECL